MDPSIQKRPDRRPAGRFDVRLDLAPNLAARTISS